MVRTTPDVARRRAHVPPPRPKPPRPETSPAAAPTPPFTPTRIRGEEGKREASAPSRPASATSCFSLETARPQGGASRPIGRQHRRPHLDDPAHAQRQGVRTAPQTAHRTKQAETDDKEGQDRRHRRAPVQPDAHSEGRAVCSPPDPPRHHLRAPFCRPERLRGKQATRVRKSEHRPTRHPQNDAAHGTGAQIRISELPAANRGTYPTPPKLPRTRSHGCERGKRGAGHQARIGKREGGRACAPRTRGAESAWP